MSDTGTGQRVPLAGVPYHALDTYLARIFAPRIITAGHKVAIVEQTSDEPIQGLMTREVVQSIAPHNPRVQH